MKILNKFYLFAFLVLFIFLFSPQKAYAWTGQYWGPTTGYVYDTYFRLCSATNCNTGVSNNRYDGWIDENLTESRGFIASNNINYSGEVQINNMVPNKFKDGYLYSVTQYLCFTNTLTFNYPSGSYLGYSASDMESLTYEANVLTNYTQATLSETPFYGGNGTPGLSVVSFNKCQATQFIFKSTNNGNTFGIVYPSSGSGTVSVIGADIVALGNANNLTSQEVQTIINNSDLASASDIEEVQESVSQVKQEMSNLNNNITDSNIDSSDDTINDLKDKIPSNAVISDLLLLPVRFLQNFVNALGSSCSRFSLGSLYGTDLFMPCINLESYLGSAIWTTIDLIISGFFVYSLRKKFIQIYENLTNLKNGGNEVD